MKQGRNYTVQYVDVKGAGATYQFRTQGEVIKHVARLLEHGTKTVGDKAVEILIRRELLFHAGGAR